MTNLHTLPADDVRQLETDVAVVGCGPVGTLLAVLLGRQGHRVTVVDKWPTPYEQPRAVTFDHEIARILAVLGIDSDDDPAIEFHDDLYYWRSAAGETLLEVDWKSVAASGWRTRYWFSQPELEKRLREVAAELPTVTIRRGWTAVGLEQDENGITVSGTVTDIAGTSVQEQIRAQYVVGADGANSFVREALDLDFTDHGFFFDWLILDMIRRATCPTWVPPTGSCATRRDRRPSFPAVPAVAAGSTWCCPARTPPTSRRRNPHGGCSSRGA